MDAFPAFSPSLLPLVLLIVRGAACEFLGDQGGFAGGAKRGMCPVGSLLLMEMEKPESSHLEPQSPWSTGKAGSKEERKIPFPCKLNRLGNNKA